MKQRILTLLACCFVVAAMAQQTTDQAVRSYLKEKAAAWQLTESDISDLYLQSEGGKPEAGIAHQYYIQRYQGIEIYNAIFNVSLKNGKVIHSGNRLEKDVANRVKGGTQPTLTAAQAVSAGLVSLGGYAEEPTRIASQESDKAMVFEAVEQTHSPIIARLRYQLMEDGSLRLSWDIGLDYKGGLDFWSMRVDAHTGAVLNKNSWTNHCSFHRGEQDAMDTHCNGTHTYNIIEKTEENTPPPTVDNASYRVFTWPLDAPNMGPHTLVTNPAHPVASPFGWHDTNGADGAEFTTTRGNNVRAHRDTDGNNTADGTTPEGGATLTFDFPYSETAEPLGNESPAIVNLFYSNNMMHDFAYVHGFNELSANFQVKNYNNLGAQGDAVIAEAMDGFQATTQSLNNANFSTPPDGTSGRMQMFVWNNSISKLVHANTPAAIAGLSFEAGTAQFGPLLNATPVTGSLQVVNDGSSSPTLGCNPLIETLTGKIAVVDRGQCFFSEKVYYAQQQGAIAAIVCNFGEDILANMAGSTNAGLVTIPSVFMPASSCNTLKQYLDQGVDVEVSLFAEGSTLVPEFVDASFDNGIIGHEYGHGISNRLTGGGTNTGCLANADQMGEGWSDFFGLVLTVNAGDVGETPRGVGTFVQRQDINGTGIRRFRYSTDMTINPHTYGSVAQSVEIHDLGEIWCVTLWDLYWKMIDQYGFNEDIFGETGGNNMAVKLVMEGMKMQPCSPGMMDGRDAILAADELLYDGANKCLIWEVFARRGMGWGSDQGSNTVGGDVTESFKAYPYCDYRLKVEKMSDAHVIPGDEFNVAINVYNHKLETAAGVTVSDIIPTGCTYVEGSSNLAPTVSGSTLTFNLGDMVSLDSISISYKLASSPDIKSVTSYFDNFENGEVDWLYESLGDVANTWSLQDFYTYAGNNAFGLANIDTSCDEHLRFTNPKSLSGTFPALRFYSRYGTEAAADGGILQFLGNGSSIWSLAENDKFVRGKYPRQIQYGTFVVPNMSAWSGSVDTWEEVIYDLRDYNDANINIRWRFASDGNTVNGIGWFIDNAELMDMRYYNSEACVTSTTGDSDCAEASNYGTIVESTAYLVGSEDVLPLVLEVKPNPANDKLVITLSNATSKTALSLYSIDGKLIRELGESYGVGNVEVNTSDLSNGLYMIRALSNKEVTTLKVIIQH